MSTTLNELLEDEAYLCKKRDTAYKNGKLLKYVWYKRKCEIVFQKIDLEMQKKQGYNDFINKLKEK